MCNDAIRIALKEKPKSRFKLIESAYFRLKEYSLHSHYILSACEIAYSVYKNKNRKTGPYVKQAFLKLDNQSYILNHLLLRIPIRPREFIYLTLQGSDYHLQFIDDPTLKRGSITLGRNNLSIAFSKEIAEIKPLGNVGIDMNERNATTSNTLGTTNIFDTSGVMEVKERYRAIRAKIGRQTRQDNRISQKLYAKYGRREKNRTVQQLHTVSKKIVQQAKEKKLRIVMENLKGIRKLYRKGNGQGSSYRGRMNSWTFREVQRQIGYKAAWEGIPVTYVNPRGTSRNCPECGSRVVILAERKLYCSECDKTWDRDILASLNIMKMMMMMACVVPQAQPSTDEAVKRNGENNNYPNPPSRRMKVVIGQEPTTRQNQKN